MKVVLQTIIFLGVLSCVAHAQTGQICFALDKLQPTKEACQDVSPELEAALQATVDDVNKRIPNAYQGVGDYVFINLFNGLFREALDRFPPQAVLDARNAQSAAKANEENVKKRHLSFSRKSDPK